MSCAQTTERISGNLYLRPVELKTAGDVLPGHKHRFSHTTFVVRGRVKVVASYDATPRMEKEFGPGEHFLVKQDWTHQITALTDDVFFMCIYSHRTPQGEVTQVYEGWDGAYMGQR